MKNIKNRDIHFTYLQAIAILLVVDSHLGLPLNIFNGIMPYNSYYMPLFVFISGYFFHEKPIGSFIKTKILKLLVPYFIYHFAYAIIVTVLKSKQLICWGNEISFYNLLLEPFTTACSFDINSPMWFVIMLFFVAIIYRLLISFCRFINKYLFLFLLGGLSLISIILSVHGWSSFRGILLPLKVAFFIPYYHLGTIYRDKKMTTQSNANYLLTCITILSFMAIMFSFFGYDSFNFSSLTFMKSFKGGYRILFPFISSVLGIVFWLNVSKCFAEVGGNNPVVNMIADNTFHIMANHLFFAYCFSYVLSKIYINFKLSPLSRQFV